MTDEIIGAVFAGGASRRLGSDKAAATVGGQTLLDRAVMLLDGFFSQVVVSVGAGGSSLATHEIVRDERPDHGPLGGLEAVLEAASGEAVFALACDLPMIDGRVVSRVLEVAGSDAVGRGACTWIASDAGRVQPLCGLYSAECLAVVRDHLDGARLSMRELLDRLEVVPVEVGDLGSDILLNVNRSGDLERAREVVGER